MKTHMIFAGALLCTSLGILSMEPDKTDKGKGSPAGNRRKQTSQRSAKSKSRLLDRYGDYFLHKSRNELIPEEAIKKLGSETQKEARKHNKLVHCYIDGCSFINDRPVKPAIKKEPTNLVIPMSHLSKEPRNHEHYSHGSQTDCQVVIDINSGKLISRESFLNEYSPSEKIKSPIDKRCCSVLL